MKITGEKCSQWRKYLHFGSVIGGFLVFALTTLAQLEVGRPRAVSQQQENHSETWAWMEIELDEPGRAEAQIFLHPTPRDSAAVISEIKQTLGCESLEGVQSPLVDEEGELESWSIPESEQRWSRDLWCNGIMLRKGLAAGGVFDPTPLLPEARSRGLRALEVTIRHYGPWTLSLEAPPSWDEGDNTFLVPVDASPGLTIRLRLGYGRHDLTGILLPALALLLLPLPVTLWIRRTLVCEADTPGPSPASFGYWRLLQWNMLGAFLLWLMAVGFLKLGPFLRFILDIYSPNRTTVLEAASYATLIFLPPMIVNLVCTNLYYPVFRLLNGVEWSKHKVIDQAIWTQVARLVPLALIVAAFNFFLGLNDTLVVFTLSAALFARILGARRLHTITSHIVPSALTLAVFLCLLSELPQLEPELGALALSGVLVVILLARILGLRQLLTVHREPHALRSGELHDRAFALAKKARVKLKQFYVLRTTTAPTAHVCFRRGDSIVLTDYLLEHLSRSEVDAVLVHELEHLKRQHPILPLLPFILGAASGYLALEQGWHVRGLSDTTLGTTLLLICLLVSTASSLLLTRHFARAADAAAADLTKDPGSLISALDKLGTADRMPLLWRIFQNPLITRLSILNCARRIGRSTGIAGQSNSNSHP